MMPSLGTWLLSLLEVVGGWWPSPTDHSRKIAHLSRNTQTDTQSPSFSDTQESSDTQSSSQSSESQTQTDTENELLLQESDDHISDTENVTLDEETNPPTPENTSQQSQYNTENSGSDTNNKNRRWIPKSTWRRMKKAELKKKINLVNKAIIWFCEYMLASFA